MSTFRWPSTPSRLMIESLRKYRNHHTSENTTTCGSCPPCWAVWNFWATSSYVAPAVTRVTFVSDCALWYAAISEFSTSCDLPGWFDQNEISAAGVTLDQSVLFAADEVGADPDVLGPLHAPRARAPTPAPLRARKFRRSRESDMGIGFPFVSLRLCPQ